MYFVHPQIKLNNLNKAISALISQPDVRAFTRKLFVYFPKKQIIFTDMGRSAFRIIIEKFKLENSEIIFPAYICDIFYPILKNYNIKPVFIDIDLKNFNIKSEDINKKISPKTKAILISHTYGFPFDLAGLRKTLGGKLLIIEDCAHSFGASRDGNYVGNLGDVSFFSLYKQFPSFRGGMLVCPEDWKIDLPKTSFNLRDIISFLNCFLFFALIFKKLGRDLAPRIIKKEKNLEPSGINRISLGLFSNFLKDFDKSSKKRKNLALFFKQELEKLNFSVQESENNVFCYFSALVPEEFKNKRDKIVLELRKKNIFCNRIWHTPIILNNEARREYQINLENFPNSVEVAGRIINFPMQDYYKEEDIKNMINNIREVIAKI